MPDSPLPALHCCWLIDPWTPKRDELTRAWGEAFNLPVTIWHNHQLGEHKPQGNVVLRHVSELCENPLAREIDYAKALHYELDHHSHAAAADVVRYMAVYQHGGLYFDLDVLPHYNIAKLKKLVVENPEQVYFDQVMRTLEIRIVCCATPKNEDLLSVMQEGSKRHAGFRERGGYRELGYEVEEIVYRTGPWLVCDVLISEGRKVTSLVVFRDKRYRTRLGQYTLKNLVKHTDFRKTEHIMARHDEVMTASGR